MTIQEAVERISYHPQYPNIATSPNILVGVEDRGWWAQIIAWNEENGFEILQDSEFFDNAEDAISEAVDSFLKQK